MTRSSHVDNFPLRSAAEHEALGNAAHREFED